MSGSSKASGAGAAPLMSRIQLAWRASTEWMASAASRIASALTLGAWPAYAATPVSSSTWAVAAKSSADSVVPRKLNFGFATALRPSTCLSAFTCARSCAPTTCAKSASSPESAPIFSASV